MVPKQTIQLCTRWFALLLTVGVLLSVDLQMLQAQNILPNDLELGAIEPNPNYYYDRETAFILAHAVDYVHGGVYMALNPDGTSVVDLSAQISNFWGIPSAVFGTNHIQGTEKSLFGLATCIRYFIQEYQRTETLRLNRVGGVEGINAQLVAMGRADLQIASTTALLGFAQSCANFITNNMIINRADDGVAEDPFNASAHPPASDGAPDIGDVVNPDRVYYWTSVNRDATDRWVDDTLHQIVETSGAPRAEGIVPWSMAELALAMRGAGLGNWTVYRGMAEGWWNWRQTTADPLPPYNDPTPPDPNDATNRTNCVDPSMPNRCLAGGARDIFYPALSYILNILANVVEPSSAPYEEGYVYGQAQTTAPITFPFSDAIQDGAYVAGYARSVVYANAQQRGATAALNPVWQDFGAFTVDVSTANPAPATPYVHFAGREWLSGTQRAMWFYHTFPGSGSGPVSGDPDLVVDGILQQWRDSINTMWDDIVGQEAWFESTAGLYKPCFSAGTDMPIGDWLAPSITDKTHEVDPVNNEITVTIFDVEDEPFPFLSWEFEGIGVADDGVQVVYTLDETASTPADWEYVTAANVGDQDGNGLDDYQATITFDPALVDVTSDTIFYYARAIDDFSNVSTFPLDVDDWTTGGDLVRQVLANAQTINRVVNNGGGSSAAVSVSSDVSYNKSVFPGVASVGDTVTWTVTVTNNSGGDATNIGFVDDVPGELDIISVSASAGAVQVNGQQVVFNIAVLPAGDTVSVTIVTRINASGAGTIIVNTVQGVSAQVISAEGLPATGETPARHPCISLSVCRLLSERLLR